MLLGLARTSFASSPSSAAVGGAVPSIVLFSVVLSSAGAMLLITRPGTGRTTAAGVPAVGVGCKPYVFVAEIGALSA